MSWKAKIITIWDDQNGATLVEYALILAVIFLAMLGAAQAFGKTFIDLWDRTSSVLTTAIGA